MKRVLALLVFTAFLLATILTASAQSDSVTLTIWGWRSEDLGFWSGVVQPALQKYHPNIKLEYRHYPGTEYDSILAAAMQAGTGPDIITLRRTAHMQMYADAGHLVPLDGKVAGLDDFVAGLEIVTSRTDGRIYGVPFAIQPLFIYYNKDIFNKYNISIPKTWGELLQIAQRLSSEGVVPFMVPGLEGWALSFWHYVTAASEIDGDWVAGAAAGENRFTDEEFVDALTRLVTLVPYFQRHYMGTGYEDMRMGFATGMCAMVMDGVWSAKHYKQQLNPNLNFGLFPAPPDTAGQNPGVFVYADGSYAINAKSNHIDEALKFLAFTTTPEFGRLFVEFTGEITAVPGVQVEGDTPLMNEVLEYVDKYALSNAWSIVSPFDLGSPSIKELFDGNLQSVISGRMSPDGFAQLLQTELARWYEPFQ